MEEIYRGSMARSSFTLVMLAIAGGMALLLGVVGIYGVISYSVLQRTREMGIRIALGAQRTSGSHGGSSWAPAGRDRRGVRPFAAAGLMRFMVSLLFEVSPVDPLTYGAVSARLACSCGGGELPPGPQSVHRLIRSKLCARSSAKSSIRYGP